MVKIAFVDICGTLFRSNTTMDFLSVESESFRKKRSSLFYRFVSKILRKTVNYDLIRIHGVKEISGRKRVDLDKAAADFYNNFLATRMIRESVEVINELRTEGYRIIFISATLDFLAETISRQLGADKVYATSLKYINEVCAGEISRDLLGRKHLLAETILRDENEVVGEIAVITDDKTDLDLVLMAQRVFIVSPDIEDTFWKKKLKTGFRIIKK
ncbi:HAD family hydrolase [Chitinophaga tropicalis]|uniref:Haloacid dehalogenase-like hydrolase n=1 Tax=Chitinophaga tropicalis TaxID=2683588 RepID=A0A7K1U0E2_9BACT|nr:haloacid dehalogenase-like hydrolase [Chitinophaga tropicalis]MVT07445.1 hypothetical protein [Chitinophaga tropicalis]